MTKKCVAPFHDVNDINGGGPHGEPDAVVDVNNGQMNGFISPCVMPLRRARSRMIPRVS